MEHSEHIAVTVAEIAAFAEFVAGAELDAPVPACAGWDLAKLIKHAGSAHRWALEVVSSGARERVDPRRLELGLPADRADLAAWLAAGASPLAAALDVDPATEVWTWARPQGSVGWWAHRMLHETLVHRADAAFAVGVEPQIEAALACDGVDELLGNLAANVVFNPAIESLRGDGESLHLHATDAEGEWTITLTPDGYTWDRGHSKATVAVRGSAADLLLLMYNRRSRHDEGRFALFGDAALLDRWLTCATL
ncbi:MAG: maleylpyruvate isomerase family mycothiol-dependent enzyme [Sporichthyaceae bacterium]